MQTHPHAHCDTTQPTQGTIVVYYPQGCAVNHDEVHSRRCTLASYCLRLLRQVPPYESSVIFLDDNTHNLEQVSAACEEAGVPCHPVHVVVESMVDEAAYSEALRRSGAALLAAMPTPTPTVTPRARRSRRRLSSKQDLKRCLLS